MRNLLHTKGAKTPRNPFKAGKLSNPIAETKRLNLKIPGICETVQEHKQYKVNDMIFCYAGNQEKNHQNEVGTIVHEDVNQYVTDFIPFSDGVLLRRIRSKPVNINIILELFR